MNQGVVALGSCTSDTRANFEKWVKANQEKYPDFIFTHDAAEKSPDRASHKLYGVLGYPDAVHHRPRRQGGRDLDRLPAGEVLLDAALAEAGIKVDPAILAKAVEDQKKRDSR